MNTTVLQSINRFIKQTYRSAANCCTLNESTAIKTGTKDVIECRSMWASGGYRKHAFVCLSTFPRDIRFKRSSGIERSIDTFGEATHTFQIFIPSVLTPFAFESTWNVRVSNFVAEYSSITSRKFVVSVRVCTSCVSQPGRNRADRLNTLKTLQLRSRINQYFHWNFRCYQ